MTIRRNLGRILVGCAAVVMCGLLWSLPALAAPAPGNGNRDAATGGDPDITITGRHYKPKVFLFFGKPKLNLSWSVDDPRFKRSFLERTVDSVWKGPF